MSVCGSVHVQVPVGPEVLDSLEEELQMIESHQLGCQELNSDPPPKQYGLLTTEHLPSPLSTNF